MFQPSPYSDVGRMEADQIDAIARLTTAAAGAGTSIAQVARKPRRRRRGGRKAPAPSVSPVQPLPEKGVPLWYWVAGVAVTLGLGAGGWLYLRRKHVSAKRAQ